MQLVTTPLEQSAIMKVVYACAISGCRLPHKLESVAIHTGFPVVRKGGRAAGPSVKRLPECLRWIGNQIFLTSYGAALASALRKNIMQIVTLVQ